MSKIPPWNELRPFFWAGVWDGLAMGLVGIFMFTMGVLVGLSSSS